ncbi:hypothetical protein Gotur_013202 [Gossypium turneri]
MRGPNGGWMGGFEMMIGLSNIFQVKAQALFEGLKFAWAQGFCQVEIESDNSLLDCRHLERLFIHVNPVEYVRSLLEDDIHRAISTLMAED